MINCQEDFIDVNDISRDTSKEARVNQVQNTEPSKKNCSNNNNNNNVFTNYFQSLHYFDDSPTSFNNDNGISARSNNDVQKILKKGRAADNKYLSPNLEEILRQHQIQAQNNEINDNKDIQKKKGPFKSVGGAIGDIIGAIVSEVLRLFGDLVGDVAREITAHGFVEFFKMISGIAGLNEQPPHHAPPA